MGRNDSLIMSDHIPQSVVQPTGSFSRFKDEEYAVYCRGEQKYRLFMFNLSLTL